jgi:single-stranded-DNA-specific exonuclease
MTDEGEDGLRGSARSIPGFSVFEALEYCADCLTKHGGHALAGGFSLKKSEFERFKTRLSQFAAGGVDSETAQESTETVHAIPPGTTTVCKRLLPKEITVENARSLDVLEPYGQGFTRPVFLISGAVITALAASADGKHTKITCKYDNTAISTVSFGISPENFNYKIGDKIDFLTYFGIRPYGGRDYLNFKLCDIRLSGIHQQKTLNAIAAYEAWRRFEYKGSTTLVKPSYEECAVIYRQLPDYTISIDNLYERNKNNYNYFKLRVILDAFLDANLVTLDLWDNTVTRVKDPAKADLAATETMKRFS